MTALRSTDIAILSARFGVARFGASRFGFVPDNVEGTGQAEPGEYIWKEDKPAQTCWTLLSQFSFCGQSPTASFSATPDPAAISADVQFTDLSTPSELVHRWLWDFGDGSTSEEQNPTHAYASAATFNITLTVFGLRGCATATGTVAVIAAPVASFTYSKEAEDTNVDFVSTATGNIDTHAWTFASGSPATSSDDSPSVSWSADATYTVTLTVTGPGGSDVATFEYAFVEADPQSGSVS